MMQEGFSRRSTITDHPSTADRSRLEDTLVERPSTNASDSASLTRSQVQRSAYNYQGASFLTRVLESSLDCIKVLDKQGRLLYMNHHGQQIMEIEDFAGSVRHQPWLSFWQGAEQAAAETAFNLACEGKTGRFDGYCATAKGSPKWWEVVVTPIYSAEGGVGEILSVSRDITARKQAELALEQRNKELDDFTRAVSHDLKAPLRGIFSLSEWIAEDMGDTLSDETRSHLDLLQQRTARMQLLIDGLLKIAKVGKEHIADEEVDVASLIQEITDSIAPPPGFMIRPSTSMPNLLCKRLLFSQVLSNLVSNAIKHHDKAEGKVDILASDHGKYYTFEIADDGPGIPLAYREKIFAMFQTLHDDETTRNTGIGLALVKKIIESEGGKLWLDEQTHVGSKFCFTWPKKQSLTT